MEQVEELLKNITEDKEAVANMKKLETIVSDQQNTQGKAFLIQKGFIEFASQRLANYKELRREYISGMCCLLIAVLTYSEMAKKKMVMNGVCDTVCKIIHGVKYKDAEMTDMTLNDLIRLCWGVMTVSDFTSRRKIITKKNVKDVLSSFSRICRDTTASVAIEMMAAISIDDACIVLFRSAHMIEECLQLALRYKESKSVTKAIGMFIANTIYSEDEYSIGKQFDVVKILYDGVNTFGDDEEVLEQLICGIRSVSNASEEAKKTLLDNGVYVKLLKCGRGKGYKTEERLMNMIGIITRDKTITQHLISNGCIDFIYNELKDVNEKNAENETIVKKSLPMVKNLLGVLMNVCFEEEWITKVFDKDIAGELHRIAMKTIDNKQIQTSICCIVQCLAIDKTSGKKLLASGLVKDVVVGFERHLKKKEVAMSAISACINLAQDQECAKALVEFGVVDKFRVLNDRFPDKPNLTKKMITAVMNILIDDTALTYVSEVTMPLIEKIVKENPTDVEIELKSLSCLVSIVKIEKNVEVLSGIGRIFDALNVKDKQVNTKMIQVICSLSSNKELSQKVVDAKMVEFLVANANEQIRVKEVVINTIACFMNFSCSIPLHDKLAIPPVFKLLGKAAEEHCNEKRIICSIASTTKNLSISDIGRKSIAASRFYTTLVDILSKHKSDEDVFKACIEALWNISIDPTACEQMANFNVIQLCHKALSETFKTNTPVIGAIIGFLSVVTNNEQARQITKKECADDLAHVLVQDPTLAQRLEKLRAKLV
ncbi:hypothetical protein EIN_498910 [Entamoeba invadens IP1]|uniref:UNC-45/Cro1/She4 central domain-containing protein n=1 Tax=Entamoeba invadens IP1 TaxID=370355 RepID=A0A0A1UDM4_ENTIV|nr:hypothetical protein EIN_498910 [Entamoeba invadens IP1]ELP94661.1 hypothetical protein EIN_498910 [Entamoeba invadens IP1]|eukprot:XP_004261432.1 hypothetical protein EIN_498910 [Entamoeba invadens IP1]